MSDTFRLPSLPGSVREAIDGVRPFDDQVLTDLRAHLKQTAQELSEDPSHAHFARVSRAALAILDPLLLSGTAGRQESIDAVLELTEFLGEGVRAHRTSTLEESFGELLRAVRERGTGSEPGSLHVNRRRLGEILMSLSLIHTADLRQALLMQRMSGKRVGEVLVEMGLVRHDEVESALQIQNRERRAG